jgi:hypothetical protein
MIFLCNDGKRRHFESAKEKLLRLGFDPEILSRDKNLVSTITDPRRGKWESFKDTVTTGLMPEIYLSYFRWSSRRSHPFSVKYKAFVDNIEWVVFLPSVTAEMSNSLRGPMDLVTFLFRLLCKVWNSLRAEPDHAAFDDFIYGKSPRDFLFNKGYRFVGYEPLSDDRADERFLVLEDENGEHFAMSPSQLGYISKVFFCHKTDEQETTEAEVD